MNTTRTAATATRSTYRPGQKIEARLGPSGWSPAKYAAFRHGRHLIDAGDGVTPAHPDNIRPAHGTVGHGGTPGDCAACHAEEFAPAIRQH